MGGITAAITQFFRFLAESVGYKSKKLDLNNQAPVVQSEVAKQVQEQKNQVTESVQKGDIEKAREDISE